MKPIANPPTPFTSEIREFLGPAPVIASDVFEETAKSILSHNESLDLLFRWNLNPYRGYFHACAYCDARPSHEYWGFGAGTDFESKLVVKINAATKLQKTFLKPSWNGELMCFPAIPTPISPWKQSTSSPEPACKHSQHFGIQWELFPKRLCLHGISMCSKNGRRLLGCGSF